MWGSYAQGSPSSSLQYGEQAVWSKYLIDQADRSMLSLQYVLLKYLLERPIDDQDDENTK